MSEISQPEKDLRKIIVEGLQKLGIVVKNKLDEAINKISRIISTRFTDAEGLNVWLKNPISKRMIEKLLRDFANAITQITTGAIQAAWEKTELKNDALLIEKFMEIIGESVLIGKVYKYFNRLLPEGTNPKTRITVTRSLIETVTTSPRNNEALKTFLNRKIDGLNLSQRVWKIADEQVMPLIESYLAEGINKGTSAAVISRDLREYLNEPDKLFRRVRDKATGKLKLSVQAQAYHPGQGVYRSSYKNAMRVAREEINQAYRQADYERWKNMDIIRGIRISLSESHFQRMPEPDICDELAGEYPKDYMFPGWHVQCLCHATAITLPKEQFIKRLRGEDVEMNPVQIPEKFTRYVENHKEQIEGYKSKPYWYSRNNKFIEE
ncbi:MAG TPA: hypothetical protein PLC80_01315 [Draconibacterium sp.]|nr:hypothetical protein [Draconibacterium sp.]